MENNIVVASFSGERSIVTKEKFQHDWGQKLHVVGIPELPFVFDVHFSNTKTAGIAKPWAGTDGVVDIPDEYFASGAPVYAWIVLHEGADDGETVYCIKIPVIPRPLPVNEEPTPQQRSEIDTAIAALNAGVAQAEESATAAAGSAEASLDSAEDSEAWAVGTVDGVPVSQKAPQYENNAAYWADKAEQSAGQAGYMFFHIDEHGHLIYERTSNVDVDFVLANGHLYVEAIA